MQTPLLTFKSDKTRLEYRLKKRADSTYLITGSIFEAGSDKIIIGMNIFEEKVLSGTVSDTTGRFSLPVSLPAGVIVFHKPGYDYFELPYDLEKE